MSNKKSLHPCLQVAILNKQADNVDGDYYQLAIDALKAEGYSKPEPMSFKRGSKGTRLHKGTAIAEVALANFLGVFTDIQFKGK
jgi:hypothetical protein